MSSSNQSQGQVSQVGCSTWTYLTNHTPQRESLTKAYWENNEKSSRKLAYEEYAENQVGTVPATSNPNRKCRDETFYGNEVLDWRDLTKSWENYVEDKDGLQHILENEEGEKIYIDNSHSFEKQYQKEQMGKFYSIENKAIEKYGKDGLTTVMLTFSASPFDNDGELLPPIDHLDSMLDRDLGSWYSVKSAISRVMSDYEYEYMRILEPHTPDSGEYSTSGYAHLHLALMVNDPNDSLHQEDFEPVMRAHTNNCKTAGKKAHNVNNTVSVKPYDDDKEGGIGAYLTAYLGKTADSEPLESEDFLKRFYSLLWASNRRQVGFSNGANEWAREDYKEKYGDDEKDDTEANEWEYWGIKQTDCYGDEEEIQVEGGNSGSYLTSLNYECESRGLEKPKMWNSVKTTNIWDKKYSPPD